MKNYVLFALCALPTLVYAPAEAPRPMMDGTVNKPIEQKKPSAWDTFRSWFNRPAKPAEEQQPPRSGSGPYATSGGRVMSKSQPVTQSTSGVDVAPAADVLADQLALKDQEAIAEQSKQNRSVWSRLNSLFTKSEKPQAPQTFEQMSADIDALNVRIAELRILRNSPFYTKKKDLLQKEIDSLEVKRNAQLAMRSKMYPTEVENLLVADKKARMLPYEQVYGKSEQDILQDQQRVKQKVQASKKPFLKAAGYSDDKADEILAKEQEKRQKNLQNSPARQKAAAAKRAKGGPRELSDTTKAIARQWDRPRQ